jgi:phage pi2 protein 07
MRYGLKKISSKTFFIITRLPEAEVLNQKEEYSDHMNSNTIYWRMFLDLNTHML